MLFQARRKTAGSAAPSVGDRLVYAIGDVHGRLDLFGRLVDAIRDDIRASAPDAMPTLIFLGDYVDRGPHSRQVVEALIRLTAVRGCEVVALRGNHEEMLLAFLHNPELGGAWTEFGGNETLLSYGLRPPVWEREADWEALRDSFVAALPPSHFKFLNELPLSVDVGDYMFVHAGVRPGVPLDRQSKDDMLWIRQDFLEPRQRLEKVIVHGHTPEAEVQLDGRRIGLDTGAYATGRLSAIRLQGEDQRVIQIEAGAGGG